MARQGASGGARFGPARLFAAVFGIAYLAVAVAELLLWQADMTLVWGDLTLLEFAGVHNVVHFLTAVALLVVVFISERASQVAAQVVGYAFVAVSLFGVIARDTAGELLGFAGPLPWAYNIIHIVTAAVALTAGYIGYATRSRTARPASEGSYGRGGYGGGRRRP